MDQLARSKRKGRPKQPSPTFHLPYELWDHETLPTIRPKDTNGLPVAGSSGIILFKFHVDESVQASHPVWASGLYDNPPLPEEDALLPSLPQVMNASVFQHLQPMVKMARETTITRPLSDVEVTSILSGSTIQPGTLRLTGDVDTMDTGGLDTDFMSRSLESFVALASQPVASGSSDVYGLTHRLPALSTPVDNSPLGPISSGSSLRARKQAKKLASELPGGAATPVPKRMRPEEEQEVEGDLKGDGAFLDSL